MASLSRGLRGLFALALAWAGLLGHAQQAVPALTGQVVDQAHVLDAAQAAALVQQLAALERRTGAQVAVLTVDSTLPEDIADFTQRVADEWKLGRATIGDGVLVVLAVKDRRVRVAVAKTLEGAIPDLEARRTITQVMAPKFQSGDYAGGLQAGVARLAALIQHEALPAPASAPSVGPGTPQDSAPWWLAALMAWVVGSSVLRALFGRKLGALLTGGAAGGLAGWVTGSLVLGVGVAFVAALLALVFGAASLLKGLGGGGLRRGGPVIFGSGLPGGWGGGGGWSGGGGGGWRSGGGGDFGGGGASGNW
jgi:uncharacterized protein